MTDTDITIRPLEPQEWPQLKAIRLEALQSHPGFYFRDYETAAAYPDSQWQGMLDGNASCTFGLFDGEQLIGMTAIVPLHDDPTGRTGMMAASYIQPEYRGRGLSRLLFQARIDWALVHTDWTTLVVSHREGNEPSRRANQAFGFVLNDREIIRWPDGADAVEWKYTLDLDALRQR